MDGDLGMESVLAKNVLAAFELESLRGHDEVEKSLPPTDRTIALDNLLGVEVGFNHKRDCTAMTRSAQHIHGFDRLFFLVVSLLLLVAMGTAGCKSDSKPPEAWPEVTEGDQPTLFEHRAGHPAIAEIDGLYLGQEHDAALRALADYCKHPVKRGAGMFGGDAYFVGCRLEDRAPLQYIRLGFWPRIDERVATLEIKRDSVPPPVVRKQFLALLDGKPNETLSHRIIQMTAGRYRFFADWDEGLDGPTHLIIGFSPNISLEAAAGRQPAK